MALTQVNSDGMKDDSIKNADIKSELIVSGNTTIGGNLNASKGVHFADLLIVDNKVEFKDIFDVTGNTTIGGNLNASKGVHFADLLIVDNQVDFKDSLNVTGNTGDVNCPIPEAKQAWVIHLEKDSGGNFYPIRTFRKASASPTLFKGKVY